jgi:ABC-type maltose transport system permease subunit
MHGPINIKSHNNTSKWQMGFNSALKGLMFFHDGVSGSCIIWMQMHMKHPRHLKHVPFWMLHIYSVRVADAASFNGSRVSNNMHLSTCVSKFSKFGKLIFKLCVQNHGGQNCTGRGYCIHLFGVNNCQYLQWHLNSLYLYAFRHVDLNVIYTLYCSIWSIPRGIWF